MGVAHISDVNHEVNVGTALVGCPPRLLYQLHCYKRDFVFQVNFLTSFSYLSYRDIKRREMELSCRPGLGGRQYSYPLSSPELALTPKPGSSLGRERLFSMGSTGGMHEAMSEGSFTPFSFSQSLRSAFAVDSVGDSESDTEEVQTVQSAKCREILRSSHVQRKVLTRKLHTKLRSARKAPNSAKDLLCSNLHNLLRVCSFLDGKTLITSFFPTCKAFFSLKFCNTLWRMVYVCSSPLIYTHKICPVADLLFTSLNGTGFDVNVLEDRERYFDLFVSLNVCGYYRVKRYMEERTKWWGSSYLMRNPQQAFAFSVGYEIAGLVETRRGKRRRCGSVTSHTLTSPGTMSLLSSCTASISNASSASTHAPTANDVLPALWKAIFNGKITDFTPSPTNTFLKGRCCASPTCHTTHFPDAELFKAVLHGAFERLNVQPVVLDVKFLGCEARVKWHGVGERSAERERERAKVGTRCHVLQPNLQYFEKSVSLLEVLIDENDAGPPHVDTHVAGMLQGGLSALRTTPAERRMVDCRYCCETVTAFDYAACHAKGRCCAVDVATSYAGSSVGAHPVSPCRPQQHVNSVNVNGNVAANVHVKAAPNPTHPASLQQQLEAELRQRRLSFLQTSCAGD